MPYQQPVLVSAILQPNGTYVARYGGRGYSQVLRRITIVGPSGSNFDLYVYSIDPSSKIDTTLRGDTNTNPDVNFSLSPGNSLVGVWTGGTVSGNVSMTLYLERDA